jgi:glyceraldehyde 3-phosphate dehydrogenase
LRYDSAHLKFNAEIEKDGDKGIKVNGKSIRVFSEKDPANIKWGDAGVDIVVDSTGAFLT